MSSTNKTANLQLNQWVGTDPVLMTDFNADNQKIDAALAGMPHIATGSYTGSGTVGTANKNTLSFSFQPKLVIVTGNNFTCFFVRGQNTAYGFMAGYNSYTVIQNVTWSGNSISWYVKNAYDYSSTVGSPGAQFQLNQNGTAYAYFAIG